MLLKGIPTESRRRTRLHLKGALIVPGHRKEVKTVLYQSKQGQTIRVIKDTFESDLGRAGSGEREREN